VFEGHASPLKGLYIPGELGYDPNFPGFAYDPEKAKQLLAEAGHANGLTVDFNYTIGAYLLDKEVAEAIQGQLAKVGITAKMNGGAISAISQQYGTQKSPGMNFFSFAPLWYDSHFIMNVHFSSNGLYRYNFEPKQDEMIQKALSTTDPKQREPLYQELERFLVLEKVVWVPLYALQDIYGVSNRLTWSPRPDQLFQFDR
jgi:peptide/nickel transport system substrate-binding protein